MNIPANFKLLGASMPKLNEEVKIIITCSNRPNWSDTTTGWLTDKDSQSFYIEKYKGGCYQVVAWAPLDGTTQNISTETL